MDDRLRELWEENIRLHADQMDLIPFARLLSAISATQNLDWAALCEVMGITDNELDSLFDRARRVWEQSKEAR